MLIGGLGFFFFGMQQMSDGLKKAAGDRIKNILHMATKVPIIGILVGASITFLIHSSSTTSVMVVGFVNAGLLVLRQAICVIMGANIGTTFTAWLVSSMAIFKVTSYALPCVGFGFALMSLGKSRKIRNWGQVLLGCGILFVGLSFMKDAFVPLKDSQRVKDIFAMLSSNPILGVLVGVFFTMILQSSGATIAITQVLAFNGVIGFSAAIPIILGDNIGTTITAQIASLGTNLAARRTAMSHTLFNVIGVTYMLFFVYIGWFEKLINVIIPGEITVINIMFYIAVSHSVFNVVNTLIFLPFIGWLEKISILMVPLKKGEVEAGPQYLEKHLLDTPPIALEQTRKETVRMLSLANRSVAIAVRSFISNDTSSLQAIPELEQAVDNLQSEITQYLVELSQRNLAREETEELPVLIHSVNDIERIGDHSENILELSERKKEQKLPFSDEAINDLSLMWAELEKMMTETESALSGDNIAVAKEVVKREENINKFQIDLKKGHVNRLNQRKCNIRSGVAFLDLVDNLEKVADHLTNVAEGVISGMRWKGHGRDEY